MQGRCPLVVIGVGNSNRGDDGAGPAVAQALLARALPGVTVRVADGEVAGLVEMLSQAACDGADVVVVDAVVSGAAAGTIHRLEAHGAPLPASLGAASTHSFGLAQAIELCRALGRLPQRVVVYGVEVEGTGIGEPLSCPVTQGLDRLIDRIVQENR